MRPGGYSSRSRLSVAVVSTWMVARSKNMPAGIASSVTVAWWPSSAMSGQYSSRLGSDGPAMASVTGLPSAPVSSSLKRAPSPGVPSADSRLDPRHAGAAAGPGCDGRRNCNVLLDDLHWDRPELDCEPQQARGIPRNLQLDETPAFMVSCPDLGCDVRT